MNQTYGGARDIAVNNTDTILLNSWEIVKKVEVVNKECSEDSLRKLMFKLGPEKSVSVT